MIIEKIDLDDYHNGSLSYCWLPIVSDGLGQAINIPVIIAKGIHAGPTLGITAVVHGNELNGMSVIQNLFTTIDVTKLSGTLIGIPVVNVPSVLVNERHFPDGQDLNRIMPGYKNGNRSQVYAHRIIQRIIKKFDYLLDLHTASFGRINSYYIRADLKSKVARDLAGIQNAQIVLHAPPENGTLRGTAMELGITSITIEVGNPDKFQKKMIRSSLSGIYNTLSYLNMYDIAINTKATPPVYCSNSYWIYTTIGGILEVLVQLTQRVKKGELIATVKNVFGKTQKSYYAPEDGIIIGKSTNPIGQSGSRIVHLGIIDS